MPTSSLGSIARLLNRHSIKTMAAALSMPLPVSARRLIDRVPFTLLAGWELVTTEAIARDEQNNVWHAGHVEDVFPLDAARVLIASETGGVWLAPTDGSFAALPLSNFWRDVDMHCFGAGPRSARHIYAGGINALFETGANSLGALANFEQSNSVKTIAARMGQSLPVSLRNLMQLAPDAPIFDWRQIPFIDTDGTALSLNVRQLVVVTDLQPPKLVLATDQGVFWSDVPAYGQGYRFAGALGMPGGQCLAVALSSRAPGQAQFVVCSPTGSLTTPQTNGLYLGTWQGGNLVMERADHRGDVDFLQWRYAVVASSAGNRSILYAAVAASGTGTLSLLETFRKASMGKPPLKVSRLAQLQGVPLPASLAALIRKGNPPQGIDGLYAVLSSADGGATWSPVGPNQRVEESVLSLNLNVSQGGYNMSIAVSHADPDIVALGWRRGPSIGRKTPQAFRWEEHGDGGPPGFNAHLHSDSHGLHFDPRDPSGNTLLACSDGGITFTRDLCVTFVSIINRHLTNLQFQGYPPHSGGSPGASGVSPHSPGLMAGALQDNGLVFSFRANGGQKPWTTIEGGDGLVNLVLENDRFLLWDDSDPILTAPTAPANRSRTAKWKGTGLDALDVLVRTASPSVPAGQTFNYPFAEPVLRPAFQRPGSNQPMYAVAAYDGSGTSGEIWGLFADSDGSNPSWDFLTAINPAVNGPAKAVASADGRALLIGTASGRILSYDSPSGVLKAMNIDPAITAPAGQVYQFSLLNNGVAMARFGTSLLRFEPQRDFWTTVEGNGLPNDEGPLQFMAVDTARTPNILYTATDFGVHASWDAGANWVPVSQGLPVRCHPSTLRFVADTDGGRQLYLFTYGRSVWKARLN
jgi:hypothetical protein